MELAQRLYALGMAKYKTVVDTITNVLQKATTVAYKAGDKALQFNPESEVQDMISFSEM